MIRKNQDVWCIEQRVQREKKWNTPEELLMHIIIVF